MQQILKKSVCVPLLAVAFVYGLVLPFMWGNNPASEFGTLSLLCEDRKIWFWLWGILFFIFNIQKYKSFKLLTGLSFIILATFIVIFAVVGKSALMEMIPVAMMQILLYTVNFTKVFD